ncbi:MAG: hypothetical protein KDA84_04855 [Planctomycetaceae bacterium]|nr:hypothetical protein [Planctomycetaceae bacterium]
MSTNTTLFARLVIWLMAITMPVQNLPAASCGCSGCGIQQAKTDGQTCCCELAEREAGTCCCSQRQAKSKPTCCSQGRNKSGSPCQCGENCRCGQSEPTQPFTPIPQQHPTEKVAQDANTSTGNLLPLALQTMEGHSKATSLLDTSTALDRCATLCRFTL